MNPKDHIELFCRKCNSVVAFSPKLYETLRPFNRSTFLFPGIVDVDFIDSLLSKQAPKENTVLPVKIGYAAGDHHYPNFKIVIPALQRLLSEHPRDIIFELFFHKKPFELRNYPNVINIPTISGLKEFYKVFIKRNWDIGIAPLVDNEFNAYKTDNKFREYASGKIAGIYSNIYTYQNSVKHCETGFLSPNTTDGWYRSLKEVIFNLRLRNHIVNSAYEYSKTNFHVSNIAKKYEEIFTEFYEDSPTCILGTSRNSTIINDVEIPFKKIYPNRKRGFIEISEREVNATLSQGGRNIIFYRVLPESIFDIYKTSRRYGSKLIYLMDIDPFAFFESEVENKLKYCYLESSLRLVDCIKVPNTALFNIAKKYNSNVVMAPFGFDFSILDKVSQIRSTNKPIIGYFGKDRGLRIFNIVMSALKKIEQDFPDVSFEFFGIKPSKFEDLKNASFIPYREYIESFKYLKSRNWTIGLAPLSSDPLNNSKFCTKYRDYGACGVPGIYSKMSVYTDVVQHGRNGLIAFDTVDSWYVAIKSLLLNEDLRKSISDKAYSDVIENYDIKKSIASWKSIFVR